MVEECFLLRIRFSCSRLGDGGVIVVLGVGFRGFYFSGGGVRFFWRSRR